VAVPLALPDYFMTAYMMWIKHREK